MATPSTNAEVLALAFNSQSFVPEVEAQRQATFLPLAPTTSASYPTTNTRKSADTKSQSPVQAPAVPIEQVAESPAAGANVVDMEVKTRRSSSLSSNGTTDAAQKRRFLKLGPVHGGEGECWSEEVVTG